jgi:hypothetical protein
MKLIFSKPVSYKDFVANHELFANSPGIYIWGFVNSEKFIPYYVGKSESSVYLRIQSHFDKIHKVNTYIIFEEGFYSNLAQHLQNLPRVAKPYRKLHTIENGYFYNKMVYYNNEDFLKRKYSGASSDINLLKKELTTQNLDNLLKGKCNPIQNTIEKVFSPENLHISYSIPTIINPSSKEGKKEIKGAETFTKFNLPNPVISDSGSYTEEIKNKFNIQLLF